MKPILLQILRCPLCRESLVVDATKGEVRSEEVVVEGLLRCTSCSGVYPVVQGVPRMIQVNGLIRATREGFEYQWKKRQGGLAEKKTVVYGYEIGKFMKWFVSVFTPGLSKIPKGAWMLDAGCGSGEKARELARLFPQHQIVAIDQSNSITRTASENEDMPNLHFVQANVWHPPFAKHSMQFAMSIGVLHHTPDTQKAFRAVGEVVAPGGDFMTWIYPLPSEDAFWGGLYLQRDRHFMGIAHLLPNWLTMLLCRLYIALFFPLVLRFLKRQYMINKERFPIYPERPSLLELYRSAVFLSFDNVMPPHQFRHGRKEVRQWYAEDGFGEVNDRYPGFFHATRISGNI